MTNPEERMDPWKEAINCYENYADEVVIVGDDFEEEFTWSDIGKMFTKVFKSNRRLGNLDGYW